MPGKPFEKGHPGGPGRPKSKPFLDWCKKWTAEEAETFLRPIAEDPKRKEQLEAIKTIMAYGIGKPVESVETAHSFDGVGIDPESAKDYLGQIIAGAAPGGVGQCAGGGAGEGAVPPPLLDSERGAGEGNP